MSPEALLSDALNNIDKHRSIRDVGTYILLAGVVAESFIDLAWPDKRRFSTLDPRPRSVKFWDWWTVKHASAVAAALLVAIGIAIEMIWGDKADHDADTIAAVQRQQIAVAEGNAKDANDRAAMALEELTVVTTPRSPIKIFDTPKGSPMGIAPLEEFKGQSISVQSINEEEPNELADQLRGLVSSCRWTVKPPARQVLASDIERGMVIWTVHPNILAPTADQLETKHAADALGEYLKSVGVWNIRRQTGSDGAWPFDPMSPSNATAIIVLVGIRNMQGEVGAWRAGLLGSPAWSPLR